MNGIAADPALLAEIRTYGCIDANACLQCGGCTLSCDLVTESASFPRWTFRLASLGLTGPLLASLDPWLCYYCGDCADACPRDAEPAEGMMTLRRYLVAQYDWTGFTGRIYRSLAWEVGALVGVGVGSLLLVYLYHHFVVGWALGTLVTAAPYMGLEHMHGGIGLVVRGVVAVMVLFLLTKAVRMHRLTMADTRAPLRLYVSQASVFVRNALSQSYYRECIGGALWRTHFILATSTFVFFAVLFFGLEWFQTDQVYSVLHPQRWLGYLATVGMVYPLVVMLGWRARSKTHIHRFSEPTDWVFPILLLLIAVSGIVIHGFRLAGLGAAAHYAFAVHFALAMAAMLVEIPFGKWSHMVYRPLAVYFQAIREAAETPSGLEERHEQA